MAQSFYATISPAGYPQFPDLVVVHVLPGFSPGSPPPRPHPEPPLGIWGPTDPRPTHPIAGVPGFPGAPEPPLGIWGPTDPRPTHPIVLPPSAPVPPDWIGTLPDPGEPGSPSNPYPPGTELPPHVGGTQEFYLLIPYVGVVGPYTMPPGATLPPPTVPPAVPDQAP